MSSAAACGAPWTLYTGLIDDAAMFPPKMADLHTALSDRLARRGSPGERFIGSFLVPTNRAADLLDSLDAAPPSAPLAVGVIGSDDLAAATEAAERLGRSDRVELSLVELRLDAAADPGDALSEAAFVVDLGGAEGSPRILCEVPHTWLDNDRLDAVAAAASEIGLDVKLRTGGTTPAAFPEVVTVARFISVCVAHDIAFKCTAGLHHAVRHHDCATGLTHHGFANLLLSTHWAVTRAPLSAIESALGDRRPAAVAAALNRLNTDQAAQIRRSFLSYGSCDTATPVEDIAELLMPTP